MDLRQEYKDGKWTISMTASRIFSAINSTINASYEKYESFLKEYLFALGSDLICE